MKKLYLHAYGNETEARSALTRYFSFYNTRRTHQSPDYRKPYQDHRIGQLEGQDFAAGHIPSWGTISFYMPGSRCF